MVTKHHNDLMHRPSIQDPPHRPSMPLPLHYSPAWAYMVDLIVTALKQQQQQHYPYTYKSSSPSTPSTQDPIPIPDQSASPAQTPCQTGGTLPTPSLDILQNIQGDLSTLSEEGKAIVTTIVKAHQTLLVAKDKKIQDLESKIISLENQTNDL
ncbi:hypothetical protein E2C01_091498 [Portunus trituberculatus]|uniref:Uncharacterized protein n=1 Tax=Portunus trituberculatus TaxID=210409 RepID=A0A5B7JHN9_PORTR|nr:hypothetical protein [Portunus trituberculatus]